MQLEATRRTFTVIVRRRCRILCQIYRINICFVLMTHIEIHSFCPDKQTVTELCLKSSSERRLTCCLCVLLPAGRLRRQQHVRWKLKTFLKCQFCLSEKNEYISICSKTNSWAACEAG